MAQQKPGATPAKDALARTEKRGGYSGGADAETVPPPKKTPSAYPPGAKTAR